MNYFNKYVFINILSVKAVKFIFPFPNSYLCEIGFSAFMGFKRDMRKCFRNVDPRIGLELTPTKRNIPEILSHHKQWHLSRWWNMISATNLICRNNFYFTIHVWGNRNLPSHPEIIDLTQNITFISFFILINIYNIFHIK